MKNKLLRAAAAASAFGGIAAAQDAAPSEAAPAAQAGGIYLGAALGVTLPTDDTARQSGTFIDFDGSEVAFDDEGDLGIDTGAVFGVLVGYEFSSGLAVEVESKGHVSNIGEFDGGVLINAWLVNAVYRARSEGLQPYLGAGIGLTRIAFFDDDGDSYDDDFDMAFGYQAKAGVLLPIGRRHGVTLEANYVASSGFEEDSQGVATEIDYASGNILVGYQYRFNAR